jgi:hypothetical protein
MNMTENADIGLPIGWRDDVIAWVRDNESVESSGYSAVARRAKQNPVATSISGWCWCRPVAGRHDWALGNYFALKSNWKAELEAIVDRHVSLEAMIPGNEGDEEIRSTGKMLWRR